MAKTQTKAEKKSVLTGELTIDQILAAIDFEDDEVEEAARTLPKLFLEAARYRVRVMRKRAQADSSLEATKVDTATAFRTAAAKNEERITETRVAEAVSQSQDVRRALSLVRDCQQHEEFAKLLLECFRLKKAAIQVVAELQGSERAIERMFDAQNKKEQLNNLRDKARRKYNRKE